MGLRRNRWSRIRSGLSRACLCLAAGGVNAAPVLMTDVAPVHAEASEERSTELMNAADCRGGKDGCSVPVTFVSDVLATPEVWVALRGSQFTSSLWPSVAVATPDSPREIVLSLLGAGVRDIRVAGASFVFALSAPRLDLVSPTTVVDNTTQTADAPGGVVRTALEAKADDSAPRTMPTESSARLREMIESLAEANPIAQKSARLEKEAPPPVIEEKAPRREAAAGAIPQHMQGAQYQNTDGWTKDAVKSVTSALVSFVKSIRELFSAGS